MFVFCYNQIFLISYFQFDSSKKLGCKKISKRYRSKLIQSLGEGFNRYNECNNKKILLFQEKVRQRYLKAQENCIEFYEKEMYKTIIHSNSQSTDEFNDSHKKYSNACLEMFHAEKVEGVDMDCFDAIKQELLKSIDSRFELYRKIRQDNLEVTLNAKEGLYVKRLTECREFYFARMETFFTDKKYMEIDDLKLAHNSNKDSALLMVFKQY